MDRNRHSRQLLNQVHYRDALGAGRQQGDSTFHDFATSGRDRTTPFVYSQASHPPYHSISRGSKGFSAASSAREVSDSTYTTASPYSPQRSQSPARTSHIETGPPSYRYGSGINPSANVGYGAAPSFTFNISTAYPSVRPTTNDGFSNPLDAPVFCGPELYQTAAPVGLSAVASQSQAMSQLNLSSYSQPDESSSFVNSEGTNSPVEASMLSRSFDQEEMPASEAVDVRQRYAAGELLLRRTNSRTTAGRLPEARISLLELSTWLTENVQSLGMLPRRCDSHTSIISAPLLPGKALS